MGPLLLQIGGFQAIVVHGPLDNSLLAALTVQIVLLPVLHPLELAAEIGIYLLCQFPDPLGNSPRRLLVRLILNGGEGWRPCVRAVHGVLSVGLGVDGPSIHDQCDLAEILMGNISPGHGNRGHGKAAQVQRGQQFLLRQVVEGHQRALLLHRGFQGKPGLAEILLHQPLPRRPHRIEVPEHGPQGVLVGPLVNVSADVGKKLLTQASHLPIITQICLLTEQSIGDCGLIIPETLSGKVQVVLYGFDIGIPPHPRFPEMKSLMPCYISRGQGGIFVHKDTGTVYGDSMGNRPFDSFPIAVDQNGAADDVGLNSEIAYFRLNLSGIFSGRFPINPSVSVGSSGFPLIDCITCASCSA